MFATRSSFLALLLFAGNSFADEPPAAASVPAPQNEPVATPESPAVAIARQVRAALVGDFAVVRRVILVAEGGEMFGVSKEAKALAADQAAALAPDLQVETHFIAKKTGADRMFASMSLTNGATARDANALMKKSGDVPTAVLALDDASFIQTLEAVDFIQRNRYRNSLLVMLAAGVTEETLQRISRAPLPVLRLASAMVDETARGPPD